MEGLKNISLKNKVFFSTLVVISVMSTGIAVATRWIFVSNLASEHVNHLTGKLWIPFLSIICASILIAFFISYWLSKYITRPISELTKMTDEISQGNVDIKLGFGDKIRCWEIENCKEVLCPSYQNTDLPCWYLDNTLGRGGSPGSLPEKFKACRGCAVYKKRARDEVLQLADSFNNMANSIRVYRSQLKQSKEQYQSLFNSGPKPLFVLDSETLQILDANASAEEVYGYSRKELLGKPFTDLGPFEYKEAGLSDFGQGDRHNSYGVYPRVQHYKKGNKPFYVNIHASRARFGKRDAIIVATTDITEMIEKDSQLIQASKMKTLGELSAGIAHELNQPLNAIKMGNEFVKMMIQKGRKVSEEHLRQVVNEVSGQVDRAAEIIKLLRTFGRKSGFDREKVDVNSHLKAVVAIIGLQLNLENIEAKLDMDEALPPVLAHSNRLEQVIVNLLTNARDAINQKKEAGDAAGSHVIHIRSFREDDHVAIAVSDTGVGLPRAAKDKIFEPFFTTKEAGQGMGLGLSIVYGIVKDYGGDIDVDSEEGAGATFKLTFPCAP